MFDEQYQQEFNGKIKDNNYIYATMLYKDYEKKQKKELIKGKILSYLPVLTIAVYVALSMTGYFALGTKSQSQLNKANEILEQQAIIIEKDGVKVKSYYEASVTNINNTYNLVVEVTNTSNKTLKSLKIIEDVSKNSITAIDIYPDENKKEVVSKDTGGIQEYTIRMENIKFDD